MMRALTIEIATIRLAPILPTTVAVVQFPSVRHATEAACEVLNLGAPIRTYSVSPHLYNYFAC